MCPSGHYPHNYRPLRVAACKAATLNGLYYATMPSLKGCNYNYAGKAVPLGHFRQGSLMNRRE